MKPNRLAWIVLLTTIFFCAISGYTQAQQSSSGSRQATSSAAAAGQIDSSTLLAQALTTRRAGFALMPASRIVSASGSTFSITPMAAGPNLPVVGGGTLGRLTKWTGFTSNNSFIGDTTIFEDKNGLVGIGTDTPTSKLTVAGMVQITLGGLKFPDGSVQTTAGVAPGQVVTSLNGLEGDVTLSAGTNITITPAGNMLTIAAPTALTTIAHDATLKGNGTAASPLGVAVPLFLSGSGTALIFQATNATASGDGMRGEGGRGGNGVDAKGGDNDSGTAGTGVLAQGGRASNDFSGGEGVSATGGDGDSGRGGNGIVASGGIGSGAGHVGGDGVDAVAGVGIDGATPGLAGFFNGDVEVTGNLAKGGGSFKIDHPLDPENKYLYHSFVESPDMLNIYNGNVTTDADGDAVITLPNWFEALNRDFRYQLTVIGTFAQAIVSDEIKGNRFAIKTSVPNVKVSWQVTGIRQDAYANQHRIPVEEDKPERERGTYLHPDAFNQPEERGVEWARNPEMMQHLKQRRIEAEEKLKQQPH